MAHSWFWKMQEASMANADANEPLLNPTEAIRQRDAHSYYAITRMAAAANQTPAEWYAAHPDGLMNDERVTFEQHMAAFDRIMRGVDDPAT